MRNGRPTTALLVLSLALFVLTGPGAPANNHTEGSTAAAAGNYTAAGNNTAVNAVVGNNAAVNKSATVLRNLTIGYLTAAKGELKNRQGLAISGALTLALKEVSE